MRTRDFQDLVVWQRAMTLTREVYELARRLPVEERFALASQMRRAAVSVPANIAEGHASAYGRTFVRHLSIAHASLMELECHLSIAIDVGYLDPGDAATARAASDEVSRMLRAMRRTLRDGLARRSTLDAPPQHTARRNRSQS
ncbi:four helix bundle protein [Roseisolibacter sp. H3M3-2]|uniref:four helix bundle protein n=1 Tax=Roseisolibacter sp. H3M3-2 TaxID=3031323 RepID=UPI0023DB1AB9|nr:four helix bundle protein [Roseisolibacter sp. H3M3-2]MDF1504565.1 four helix bundle protein [Roseisolibacter sp. H3M3-2]